MIEKIEQNPEENIVDLEKLAVKFSIRDITHQEKMQEASKPLYLKRYE